MNLYLIRHAIAEARDPQEWPDDSRRPLTRKGVRRFRSAARGLREIVPDVDVVLSSPYTRAWDTAMILHNDAGWPQPIACDELKDQGPGAVIRALMPYRDTESIALVGHEPDLARLAGMLLSQSYTPVIQLKKGAALCLSLQSLSLAGGSELRWLLPPRVLRRLA